MLKKKDKFTVAGKKRHTDTVTPTHEGTVVAEGKDYYDILWDCSVTPIRIEKTRTKSRGKHFKIERKQDA